MVARQTRLRAPHQRGHRQGQAGRRRAVGSDRLQGEGAIQKSKAKGQQAWRRQGSGKGRRQPKAAAAANKNL